jgi:DNA invertase Pin-like site-specific DNA recombinase
LADSDRNEVIERYLAGEAANALASIYDVNRATVFAILQRAGIKSRYRILTDHDIAATTEMYENGQSLASIAKHFGVSDGTILHAFRRLDIPTRGQGTNQWINKPARPPA